MNIQYEMKDEEVRTSIIRSIRSGPTDDGVSKFSKLEYFMIQVHISGSSPSVPMVKEGLNRVFPGQLIASILDVFEKYLDHEDYHMKPMVMTNMQYQNWRNQKPILG